MFQLCENKLNAALETDMSQFVSSNAFDYSNATYANATNYVNATEIAYPTDNQTATFDSSSKKNASTTLLVSAYTTWINCSLEEVSTKEFKQCEKCLTKLNTRAQFGPNITTLFSNMRANETFVRSELNSSTVTHNMNGEIELTWAVRTFMKALVCIKNELVPKNATNGTYY